MRLLAAFIGAVLLLGGNSPRELRFCISGDPKTFDALHVSEQRSELIRFITGGVLLHINRLTGGLEPELAESWKISDGDRTIAFHLRSGLRFSDGTPLGAADVARTLNTALDPRQASPAGDTLRSQKGDPEVVVLSPLEVRVRYPQPRPGLDRIFDTISIVPAGVAKFPASAGPFYVTEYKPGEFVRLSRNPYYWKRGQPNIDSIRIDIQANREMELTRFVRGELHLINRADPETFARLTKEQPQAARNAGASYDSEFLWFNQTPFAAIPDYKKKWFGSTSFRHAISLSLHRDDIARVAWRGYAHAAAGPFSPSNRFWFNAELKPLRFDAQAAMQLLSADGFLLRDGLLMDREGHAVEFSLITNAGSRPREATAAVIQDDLRRMGITVHIVTLDFGSLLDRVTKTFNYEAAMLGYSNVEEDPIEQMNVWLSSGPQHAWWPLQKKPATAWEARIDELELRQASEASREVRKKAFDEVQRIAVEQEPIIYLVNPDYLAAVSPALRGVEPVTAPPQILWNIESLRLE